MDDRAIKQLSALAEAIDCNRWTTNILHYTKLKTLKFLQLFTSHTVLANVESLLMVESKAQFFAQRQFAELAHARSFNWVALGGLDPLH